MSRSVSDIFRQAAQAQESGEAVIVLLTITHPDLEDTWRFSTDPTERVSTDPLRYRTVSRGNDYEFLPMRADLPGEREGEAPAARLILDNVSREMIAVLRSTNTPATVQIELVLGGTPDTVEATWPKFKMINAVYDAQTIQCNLALDGLGTEPFGYMNFDPSRFPSLFDNTLG